MYLLASVAAVSLFALLLLEGLSFFAHKEQPGQPAVPHPPHLRLFGGLTLLIALPIGLLQLLLLVRSTLIYSPEFGAFLVQGIWARYLLGIAVGTIAIASTLLWHVARVADAPEKAKVDRVLMLMMAAGAIVAVSSVLEIHPLQSGTDPAVYAFDLWWPPLVAWLTICLVKAGEVMVGITGKFRRPAVTSLALVLVGVIAGQRPEFVDGRSSEWWSILTGLGALAFLGLAGIGLFRRGEQSWWSWMRSRVHEYRSFRYKSLGQVVAAMLPVLAFGRIVHLETAGPSLALSALVFVWVVLAEAFGGEPLIQASRWPIVRSLRTGGSIRAAICEAWANVRGLASKAARRLWPPPAQPGGAVVDTQSPRVSWVSMVAKGLVGLAVLIAIGDISNARRTIFYPFDPGDLTGDKALADTFPTLVLHEIDVLQRELSPLMVLANGQRTDPSSASGPVIRLLDASSSNVNGLEAAISKMSDLDFGFVKIPASLLVVPIQTPMRRAIGARVITGALHGDSQKYSAFAMSSGGETWSGEVPATSAGVVRKPVDMLNELASVLAFQIVTTSIPPTAGLTRSAEAFADFRQGLTYWDEYQQSQWDSLSKAIDAFRLAAAKDPKFSLAYYRLGIALQEEGRPSVAAEAFTASISANPTFAPSYVAKANVLYYFDWYKERLLVADAVGGSAGLVQTAADDDSEVAAGSRRDEARRLWRKVLTFDTDVVSPSDRASSYFGLCTDAHEQFDADTDAAFSAYYYCRRAADLYSAMKSADPQITTTHSLVLDTLGLIFEQRLRTTSVRDTTDWHCSASTIDFATVTDEGEIAKRTILTGPYATNALEYYERALTLTPLDPVIRCNAASVMYAMGNGEPMSALEGTAEAHSHLAEGIGYDTDHPIRSHRVALKEYREAIIRDPADTDARNAYAYRFWEWQYAAAQTDLARPDEETAVRAEEYAREAVRVARLKTDEPSHQAMLLSTLGEVLLARGRPHEAIWHLRKARDLAPAHAAFDQVRWDLAQADQCAVASDRDRNRPDLAEEIKTNLYEAQELTTLIDTHERARESPRPGAGQWLDMSRPSTACVVPPDPMKPTFQLMGQSAAAREPCDWQGVTARIDAPNASPAYLRIIGGDAREHVEVGDGTYVFLTSAPAPTHGDYFARLEDEDGNALSRTEPIDTTSECSQNLITLVFRNVTAPGSPVQTTRSTGGRGAEPVSRAGLAR